MLQAQITQQHSHNSTQATIIVFLRTGHQYSYKNSPYPPATTHIPRHSHPQSALTLVAHVATLMHTHTPSPMLTLTLLAHTGAHTPPSMLILILTCPCSRSCTPLAPTYTLPHPHCPFFHRMLWLTCHHVPMLEDGPRAR
jgi:hypothetical protein